MSNLIVTVLKVLLLCSVVKSEVYSSVKEVEKLIMTHKSVTAKLMSYVADENKRLKIVENYIKMFTEEQARADVDVQKYVANPINSFTLIKRLYTDFEYLKNLTSESSAINWDEELVYPSERDFSGAVTAIGRLQDVYNLSSTQLLAGRQNISSSMTADDCYKLASQLYATADYGHAAEWFEAAYHKMTDDEDLTFTRTDVMKQIIKSHHHRNSALDTTAYEWAVKLNASESDEYEIDPVLKPYYKKIWAAKDEYTAQTDLYLKLCREDIGVSASNTSKLHCSYLRRGPYLNLAPVKMEQLHREPDVFLFHDVLSNDEMDTLKDLANPKFERAATEKNKVGGHTVSELRVGKLAWLYDHEYDIVKTVQRRTADFTGLDMTTAEPLQVLNYGIGGQYEMHYDAVQDPKNTSLFHVLMYGNRIATILFYMSDVEEGGATVFPSLRVAVRPKKGTALFWLNLDIEGDRDERTLHAACPVLYGSKWVANFWLHQQGQELMQQCTLQHLNSTSHGYKSGKDAVKLINQTKSIDAL